MNERLSKYLQALAHELRGLPREKREDEVREVRQHLEAIIARMVEGGASEEEAVEAAIAQFGRAEAVGRDLRRVQPEREGLLRVAAAVACAMACYCVLTWARLVAVRWLPVPTVVILSVFLSIPFVSGLAAGYLAPRWGGRAAVCVFTGVALTLFCSSPVWIPTVCTILISLSLGAFAGSQWAQRRRLQRV